MNEIKGEREEKQGTEFDLFKRNCCATERQLVTTHPGLLMNDFSQGVTIYFFFFPLLSSPTLSSSSSFLFSFFPFFSLPLIFAGRSQRARL